MALIGYLLLMRINRSRVNFDRCYFEYTQFQMRPLTDYVFDSESFFRDARVAKPMAVVAFTVRLHFVRVILDILMLRSSSHL